MSSTIDSLRRLLNDGMTRHLRALGARRFHSAAANQATVVSANGSGVSVILELTTSRNGVVAALQIPPWAPLWRPGGGAGRAHLQGSFLLLELPNPGRHTFVLDYPWRRGPTLEQYLVLPRDLPFLWGRGPLDLPTDTRLPIYLTSDLLNSPRLLGISCETWPELGNGPVHGAAVTHSLTRIPSSTASLEIVLAGNGSLDVDVPKLEKCRDHVRLLASMLEDVLGKAPRGRIGILIVETDSGYWWDTNTPLVVLRPDDFGTILGEGIINTLTIAKRMAGLWWGSACRILGNHGRDLEAAIQLGLSYLCADALGQSEWVNHILREGRCRGFFNRMFVSRLESFAGHVRTSRAREWAEGVFRQLSSRQDKRESFAAVTREASLSSIPQDLIFKLFDFRS